MVISTKYAAARVASQYLYIVINHDNFITPLSTLGPHNHLLPAPNAPSTNMDPSVSPVPASPASPATPALGTTDAGAAGAAGTAGTTGAPQSTIRGTTNARVE